MKKKYCLFMIVFLGFIAIAGCATATSPIGGETVYLPLNEGVKDLSFLSSSEVEILETVNKSRMAGGANTLQPLKISKGLSFAAKERTDELDRTTNASRAAEEDRERLFERVGKFGTWKGSVAEIASHKYPVSAVVPELMKNSSATGQQPQPYFMDANFTIVGVGCTSAGIPGPICVITFASEFNEGR